MSEIDQSSIYVNLTIIININAQTLYYVICLLKLHEWHASLHVKRLKVCEKKNIVKISNLERQKRTSYDVHLHSNLFYTNHTTEYHCCGEYYNRISLYQYIVDFIHGIVDEYTCSKRRVKLKKRITKVGWNFEKSSVRLAGGDGNGAIRLLLESSPPL